MNGQFVICPDNGLFTLIDAAFNEKSAQLYYEGHNKQHFFWRMFLVDAALHLLAGKTYPKSPPSPKIITKPFSLRVS